MAQHAFQAEVRQLLDIVINSLYTDKDIFLRELVSNASDSLEKLRHLELTQKPDLADASASREIRITIDKEGRKLTIADTGIGMTEEELVKNLGTIAHSGSKAFLAEVGEDSEGKGNVIGKFGVGFYSVFMVAQKVEVFTRSWRPGSPALRWESDGVSGFEVEQLAGEEVARGVRIVIHMKEGEGFDDFLYDWKLKDLLEKHSNFVSFPIFLGDDKVNTVEALWLKSKSDVTEEQFDAFYKFISKHHDSPTYRFQFKADSPIVINSLLFVPKESEERPGMAPVEPGVALYCRRVLIDSNPKDLMPEWLRFAKGVIDSDDLPLNISRETMQDSALVRKIRAVVTKKFINFLEEQSHDDTEKFEKFHAQFGRYIKEGTITDYEHRNSLAKLIRFESSMTEPGKLTSFDEYLSRAKSEQKQIYFQVAPNRQAIESGPYLEAFKERGLEVVYFFDPIDSFLCEHLHQFAEKDLVSVERDDVTLDAQEPKEGKALSEAQMTTLCDWAKTSLTTPADEGTAAAAPDIETVRASNRLVDSPAAVYTKADGMTSQIRNMMRQMGQELPAQQLILEFNPRHPLIQDLAAAQTTNPEAAARVAAQLVDNAKIAAGLLDDPRAMVQRLQQIMRDALKS